MIEKVVWEKAHGAGSQEMWNEFQLCHSLAVCPWIYGFPSLALLIKWKYLNILECAKTHSSSKTTISLWPFINVHLVLWVLNSLKDCRLSLGLSVFLSSLTQQVPPRPLLFIFPNRAHCYIYPCCLILWEMEGKSVLCLRHLFCLTIFIFFFSFLERKPRAKQFWLCKHFLPSSQM